MTAPTENSERDARAQAHVRLLDYLLRMRQDTLVGRLGMYLGEPRVDLMQGFISGYNACLVSNGSVDEEYGRFREWLRAKGEFPREGWAAKYLRDCQGDHEQAIRKVSSRSNPGRTSAQRGAS
jgi:hypothetical protein